MKQQGAVFGFWMPVIDEESAAYAVKMSGLPLFLVGLNTFALVAVIDQHWAQVIAAVFAVLFVSLAFRIRAACTAWAPIAAFLSVTFFSVAGHVAVFDRHRTWVSLAGYAGRSCAFDCSNTCGDPCDGGLARVEMVAAQWGDTALLR